MFVGEQPGGLEERSGHPFVGPAGKLFDRALAETGVLFRMFAGVLLFAGARAISEPSSE